MGDSFAPIEKQIVRCLEMGELALRAAAAAKNRETREDYLAIAMSWLDLAEHAYAYEEHAGGGARAAI